MSLADSSRIISSPPKDRPALLEGRWLGFEESLTLASGPASIFEGPAEGFSEFSNGSLKMPLAFPGVALSVVSHTNLPASLKMWRFGGMSAFPISHLHTIRASSVWPFEICLPDRHPWSEHSRSRN